jgi:hypothetical protein
MLCALQVDGPGGGRSGGNALSSPLVRGAVYQALATLSRRVPEVFQVSIVQSRRKQGVAHSDASGCVGQGKVTCGAT